MEVALRVGVSFLEPTCYGGLAMFSTLWKLCELFRGFKAVRIESCHIPQNQGQNPRKGGQRPCKSVAPKHSFGDEQ